MKLTILIAVLVAPVALASNPRPEVRSALDDALLLQADIPAQPPTLPTQASDAARTALSTKAFGQQGAAERAAHANAQAAAAQAARARQEAAKEVAHGAAADAERSATGELHSAAGQARAAQAHDSHPGGPDGHGPATPPGRPSGGP